MSDELKRSLTLWDAISIVAGSMIGCAIFIVTADIARQTNSAWLVLLVWLIAGVITLCGALCYGELSASIKDEGGQYIYLEKIFSKKVAFLYGWTLFFVIQTGTIAAVTVAFSKFVGLAVPVISSSGVLFTFCGIVFTSEKLLSIFVVLFLTFINSRGVKEGILVQNIFTVTKVLSILTIIIFGIFFGMNTEVIRNNFANPFTPITLGSIKSVLVAVVGALFASITWNNVTFIASEIKEPEKNVPRALMLGSGLVIALYILMNCLYLGSLNLVEVQNSFNDIVAGALTAKILGGLGIILISIIISVSAFGCANGMILTGSRVYYKMAKDKLFFKNMSKLSPKYNVPSNALYMQALWICILILWGNYLQLLDYVIYASLIFYILTIAGIFVYRRRNPELKPVYRVPTFIPILFLVLSTAIIIFLTIYKPMFTVPGLIITIAGLPVYHFWQKKK